ncbi:MAG: hypothetical protein AB2L24_33105 [Mangrovibacterium sp.]
MNTRRDFLKISALGICSGIIPPLFGRETDENSPENTIQQIRALTLSYIRSMRFHDRPYGCYRYAAGMPEPTLYSSTYAAMTRGLYRDLGSLSNTERKEWVKYLQSHQQDDGLYCDLKIYGEGWYKGDPEWCGRRHLTCHVLSALTCLGTVAEKPLRMLEPFYNKTTLIAWLEARNWDQADFAGNEVLNIGTLLQYARDFQNEARASSAMNCMLDWLTSHHMNPETGLWGNYNVTDTKGLSKAVMGAYHFWLLYFYDHANIPYPEHVVDSVLRTLNPRGGFGWGVHGPNSSACEDIDSIDPLARMMFLARYREDEIKNALRSAVPHVLAMQNDDGGYVWVRGGDKFEYGHPLMATGKDVSGMFPTWFRTLSLTYLGKALPDSVAGKFDWDFCSTPGCQFAIQP